MKNTIQKYYIIYNIIYFTKYKTIYIGSQNNLIIKNKGDVMNEVDFDAYKAQIKVIGAGGGGCNTITRLTDMEPITHFKSM